MSRKPLDPFARAWLSALIVGICALPSVLLGLAGLDMLGMLIGMSAVLIAAFLIGGSRPLDRRIRTDERFSRALRGAMWFQVACTLIPVRFIFDLIVASVLAALFGFKLNDDDAPFPSPSASLSTMMVLARGFLFLLECLLLVALIYPLLRPQKPALACLECDYDLRASLEFGRCPECGKPIHPDAYTAAAKS